MNNLVKIIKGKGLPNKEGISGDLFIEFNVIFPDIPEDKINFINGLSIEKINYLDIDYSIEEICLN